ncbi:MAG: TRAP transporter large permease [Gammaproteobacteria bacterium]
MSTAFALCLGVFLTLAAIGVPVGFAMMAAAVGYLFAAGQDPGLVAEQVLNGLFDSFVLLAVPLFILAANFMNAGTVSDRLLSFCLALVGRFKGGLAQVNVLASLIFSGMSGSAIADAAGIGKVITEMMSVKGRYPPGFAAALTAASSTIGPIIPPSIPMVLYALVSDTSIGYLFLGGVIPGLSMAAVLMILNWLVARRRSFPSEDGVALARLPGLTLSALPALMLPVILLAGIYGGATTPTEAAAVAAAYALVLAAFFYRALSFGEFFAIVVRSARATAVVGIIIAGALIFNYIVASENIPARVASTIDAWDLSPVVFLLTVNLIFLALGCLFDATTLLLVAVPIFLPAVRALGIDPVHFGVVIVINIMLGLITPPYGVVLFVLNGVTGIPLRKMFKEIWPFVLVLALALLVLALNPGAALWLPRQFGYLG